MDEKNQELVQMLRLNAREAVSSLANKLHLSRTAVYERIRKLEKQGVIQAYTVKLGEDAARQVIRANVMISIAPQSNTQVVTELKKISALDALHSVSGAFDLLAMIRAESTDLIDQVLDRIGAIEGVEKTQSSILLSTKFER